MIDKSQKMEVSNEATKSMKRHKLSNSRKHEEQTIINMTKNMTPSEFTKLYSALLNNITKTAASLLFQGAKCHKRAEAQRIFYD